MPIQSQFPTIFFQAYLGHLFRDEFITTASAPLTSPRTAEPGPGTATITDTSNAFSIADGKLTLSGSGTTAVYAANAATRVPGLLWYVRGKVTAASAICGFGAANNNATYTEGFVQNSVAAQNLRSNGVTVNHVDSSLGNTDVDIAFVLRTLGCHILATGGGYGTAPTFRRLWVGNQSNAVTLYPKVSLNAGSAAATYQDVTLTKLDTPWNTEYGPVTERSASPTTGTLITTLADSWNEFTWTPVALEVLEIRFRRTDDNNCWLLRCDQAAATLKLYELVAGVETERDAGKTQTWTAGTAFRIIINPHGARITTWVNSTIKHNYASATYNQTATGLKASGFTSGSNLISWPGSVQLSIPNSPAGFAPANNVQWMSFGDSKTANGVYQPFLTTYLEAEETGSQGWTEAVRIATGGYEWEDHAATIAANLAAVDASLYYPARIAINLGANDLNHGEIVAGYEATLKGYVLDITDRMHAKWPSAQIYLMRTWTRGFDTEADMLAGWLSDCVALRSNFLNLGPDERVFLKGSDNGATYTTDGTHPTNAGYDLTAQQWLASFGF